MEQEDMQNPLIALAVKFGQDAFQGILKKADFDKDGELDFTDPDGEGPKVAEVPAMFDRIGHAADQALKTIDMAKIGEAYHGLTASLKIAQEAVDLEALQANGKELLAAGQDLLDYVKAAAPQILASDKKKK